MDFDLDNFAGIPGDFAHYLGIAAADYPLYTATPGGPDNPGKIYVAAHGRASHDQLARPFQLHRCFVSLLLEVGHGNNHPPCIHGRPNKILEQFELCSISIISNCL
jgi:hypothetical protein